MAGLILTKAELAANTFLEWDDASLGRAVKKAALTLGDQSGGRTIRVAGVGVVLINELLNADKDSAVLDLRGATYRGKELGDWLIHIEQQ